MLVRVLRKVLYKHNEFWSITLAWGLVLSALFLAFVRAALDIPSMLKEYSLYGKEKVG